MKIRCDKCRGEFELDKKYIKTSLENNNTRQYYSCPLCKEEYTIAIYSFKAIVLKRKIDKIRGSKNRNTIELEKLLKEYKSEMDKINKK